MQFPLMRVIMKTVKNEESYAIQCFAFYDLLSVD